MKVLWVNPHFLHPTTKGGQIRTLEMLRWLNRWHEVHFVALDKQEEPEGVERSVEYSARAYPVPHRVPPRRSLEFIMQAGAGLFSSMPLAISRYQSMAMRAVVADLLRRERFDRVVCDFLSAASNVPSLGQSVLFQHNVETTIWERHAQNARDPVRRAFFGLQARRMAAYEGKVCRTVSQVIAVSVEDAARIRQKFGVARVAAIPTGVDLDRFCPPSPLPPHLPQADFVFLGSMDWLPNVDGACWFAEEVFPLIRRHMPAAAFAIVGRSPDPRIVKLSRRYAGIVVTGTVPDTRPWLWGSAVSIVPLRIGGGTRLKIFEAMAAHIPIVSTTVGAEGLPVTPGENILIADTPETFARRCLDLARDAAWRARIAQAAREMVAARFSWEQVTRCFERFLLAAPELKI